MNKKKICIMIFAVVAIIAGIIFGENLIQPKDDKYVRLPEEDDATRYEWMAMLCEQSGMTEYRNGTPYFSDVTTENEYFSFIQSAVEWNVLGRDEKFDGDICASGRFITLTAMKTIGQEKLKIYLNTDETITNDTYIELAIKHDFIKKSELSQSFSREECQRFLEKLEKLYFGKFWKEDFEQVELKDSVVELTDDVLLQYDDEDDVIIVQDDVTRRLEEGTVVVFKDKRTGFKVARQIVSKDEDNRLRLSEVAVDEVIESLAVSDIQAITFESIVNYYGLEESLSAEKGNMSFVSYSNEAYSKGFCIELSSKEGNTDGKDVNFLDISITDNDTGASCHLPIDNVVEKTSVFSAKIDVNSIYVASQLNYTDAEGVTYADVALDTNSVISGSFGNEWTATSKETKITKNKILLCKTPIAIGTGWVGVTVDIYLVIEADGSIYIEAQMPMQYSICYEKGKGVRSPNHNMNVTEPIIGANGNITLAVRTEPTISLLSCIDVMDAQVDVGAGTSAELFIRPNQQVCVDVTVGFPTLRISICGDGPTDTLIGSLGVSVDWELITPETAPLRWGLHHEWFPDGTSTFVDKCTYDLQLQGTYIVFTTNFKDEGDYYTAQGSLYDIDCIPVDIAETIEIGETYTIHGKNFIYEGKVPFSEMFTGTISTNGITLTELCIFSDSDNNMYYTFAPPMEPNGVNAYGPGYTICYYETNETGDISYVSTSMSLVIGDYTFKIRKDAFVDVFVDEPVAGIVSSSDIFTVEECIEASISDYRIGIVFSAEVIVPFSFWVDEGGYVVGLSPLYGFESLEEWGHIN